MDYIMINDSELEDLERMYFEKMVKYEVRPLKESMLDDRTKNVTKHEMAHKRMFRSIIAQIMQFSSRKTTENGAARSISAISMELAKEAIKSGYCEEAMQCLKIAKDPALTQGWSVIGIKDNLLQLTHVLAQRTDKEAAEDQMIQLVADVAMGEYGKDTTETVPGEVIEKAFYNRDVKTEKVK